MGVLKQLRDLKNSFNSQTAIEAFVTTGGVVLLLVIFKIILKSDTGDSTIFLVVLQNMHNGLIEFYKTYTTMPDGLTVASYLFTVLNDVIAQGKNIAVHFQGQHVLRSVPFLAAFFSMNIVRSLYKPGDFIAPWQSKLMSMASQPFKAPTNCDTFVNFFNSLVKSSGKGSDLTSPSSGSSATKPKTPSASREDDKDKS